MPLIAFADYHTHVSQCQHDKPNCTIWAQRWEKPSNYINLTKTLFCSHAYVSPRMDHNSIRTLLSELSGRLSVDIVGCALLHCYLNFDHNTLERLKIYVKLLDNDDIAKKDSTRRQQFTCSHCAAIRWRWKFKRIHVHAYGRYHGSPLLLTRLRGRRWPKKPFFIMCIICKCSLDYHSPRADCCWLAGSFLHFSYYRLELEIVLFIHRRRCRLSPFYAPT